VTFTAPPERPALPGELCTCGRPAIVVYHTERWGDVGACLVDDGGQHGPWPCVFCGGAEAHWPGYRCPRYTLRRPDHTYQDEGRT
jgi:hypothetical protein